MAEFPFGIDPAGWVPEPAKPVHVEVEGVGRLRFGDSTEPVAGMAAQVVLMMSESDAILLNNTSDYITVTGWDPIKREIKVKLNH